MKSAHQMSAPELLRYLREFDQALAAPRTLQECEVGHHECSTAVHGTCHVMALTQYRTMTGSLAH